MPSTVERAAKSGDPGLSLWLIPPQHSDIFHALDNAITHQVPHTLRVSDAPRFEPHITLTSRIPRHAVGTDPQKWLDEMDFPSVSEVEVKFQELALGDVFFKKLFIRCGRTESLLRLAASCRVFSSSKAGEAEYDPHVSLLYSHDSVSEGFKKVIQDDLAKNGIATDKQAGLGWKGGSVWLVPTDGDVVDWHPIARRSWT